MAKKLRIVLAQLNLKVGDIDGNVEKLIQAAHTARDTHLAEIIVFPELSITGYPPEDLLLRKSFIDAANVGLNTFKNAVQGIHCIVGHPYQTSQGLLNSCSVIHNGTILGRYNKQHLPNYGVFDENRYFVPGNSPCVVNINGIPVGLLICEDLWYPGPPHQAAIQGARLILVPNASPFEVDKHTRRVAALAKYAKSANAPIVYVNNVGGQDELIFDGGSMVVDQTGKLCQHAGFFKETLFPFEVEISSAETTVPTDSFALVDDEKRIYDALVLGVRDYVHKNGFQGVMIGVSGGIDSALTLAIAVDALGKENVTALFMPSRYTASISEESVKELTKNLGLDYQTYSIEPAFSQFISTLNLGEKPTLVEENLQSRCRGVILMALSNKTGKLVLTTGNRSEYAVGYTTLYGDTVGALAVLKDIPKTWVYRLTDYRNNLDPIIPQSIVVRPPTAELAPNQKDEDTLPPYGILDKILDLYLNQEQGVSDIIAQGFDAQVVEKVVKLIKNSEYKRRQCPIGIRINHKSFGKDWRYPITNGFKG